MEYRQGLCGAPNSNQDPNQMSQSSLHASKHNTSQSADSVAHFSDRHSPVYKSIYPVYEPKRCTSTETIIGYGDQRSFGKDYHYFSRTIPSYRLTSFRKPHNMIRGNIQKYSGLRDAGNHAQDSQHAYHLDTIEQPGVDCLTVSCPDLKSLQQSNGSVRAVSQVASKNHTECRYLPCRSNYHGATVMSAATADSKCYHNDLCKSMPDTRRVRFPCYLANTSHSISPRDFSANSISTKPHNLFTSPRTISENGKNKMNVLQFPIRGYHTFYSLRRPAALVSPSLINLSSAPDLVSISRNDEHRTARFPIQSSQSQANLKPISSQSNTFSLSSLSSNNVCYKYLKSYLVPTKDCSICQRVPEEVNRIAPVDSLNKEVSSLVHDTYDREGHKCITESGGLSQSQKSAKNEFTVPINEKYTSKYTSFPSQTTNKNQHSPPLHSRDAKSLFIHNNGRDGDTCSRSEELLNHTAVVRGDDNNHWQIDVRVQRFKKGTIYQGCKQKCSTDLDRLPNSPSSQHVHEFNSSNSTATSLTNGDPFIRQNPATTQHSSAQEEANGSLLINAPVWTPASDPQAVKRRFTSVRFKPGSSERKTASPTISRASSTSLSEAAAISRSCKEDGQGTATWTAAPTSLVTRPIGREHSSQDWAVKAAASRVISLPQTQSATVTLLQQARHRKQLQVSTSIPQDQCDNKEQSSRPEPIRQVDGIGQKTANGMPVALRSAVKAENKREWYKNVYDSLHRHPQDEIYTDKWKQVEEYFSEPELRTLGVDQEDDDTGIICSGSALPDLEENNHRPRRIDNFTQSKSSASTHVSCEQKSAFRQLLLKSNSFTNAVLSECRSDPCFKYNRRSPSVITDPSPELQKGVYSQIQRGGDIPACGLRKTAHDKPKEPREYENSLSGTTSAESLSREQPEKLKNSILASNLAGITLLYERQGDIQEHRSYPQSDREMRLGMNGQCKRSQSACQNRAVNTMEKSAFEKQIKPTKKRQRSRTFSSWETTLPASTLGASGTIQITAANSTITKELSMSRSENNLCHTYEVSLDPTVIERNASSVSELNTRQGTTENKIIDKPCSQHSAPVSPIKQSRASVRRNIRSVMSEDEKRMREKCWNNPKLRQKINPITKSRISTQVKSPISQQNHGTHPRMTASRSTSDIANSKAKQQAVKTRNLTRPSSTASLLQKRPNSRLCSTAVKTTTDGVSKVVQPTKIILITQKNSNTSSIRVGPSLDIIASCKKAEKLNKKETLTPHVVPSKVKTKNKTVNSLKTELNRSHSYTNMDSARSSADSNSRHNVSHATSASEETGYISSESHLEQRHTDNEISKKQFGLLQDHMTDDQSPMCRNLRSDQGVKNSITRSWQYHSSVKDYGDSFCNDDHQKYDTLLSIPLSIKSTMSEDTKSSTDQLTSITAELNTLREWHSSAEKGDFKHEVFLDKIQQLLRISRRSQHFQKLKPHYIRLQQLTQSGLSSDEKDFKEVMDKVRILLEMLRVYESFDAVIQTRGKLVSNWRGDIALQCRRHSVEDLRRVFSGEMEHTSKLNCKIRTVADRISPRTCYSVDVTDLNDLGEKNEFLLPVRDLVSTRSTSLAIRSTKLLRSRQERIDRPFYFSDYQNTEPSAACVPNQVQKPPRMYDAKHGIQNRFHSLPHNRRQRYSSYRYDIIDGNYPVSECSPSFINSSSKIDLNVSQKRPLPTPRQTNSFLVEKHDDNTVITSSPFYRSRMVENGTQYHKTLKRIVISSLNSIRRKVKYKAKGSNGKPLAGVETVIKNIHQDNAVRDSAYRSTPHAHNAKSRIGTIGQVSKLYDRCAKLPTLGSLSISSPDLGTTREMTPYTTPWSRAGKNPLLLVALPRPIPPQTLEFGPLNTTTARNISAQPQSQYTGPLSSSSPRSNSTEGVGHDFGKTANKQYSTAHLDWAIHRPIGRYVPDSGGGRCGVVTAPRPPLRRHLLIQRDGQTTCSPGYIISQPGELGHQATPSTTTTTSSHLSSVDDAEYNQRNVHIHYPSPVRWRQLAHIPQHQLQHQQQLNMKTFYQLESQRKQLVSAEDRNRRRHGDFFLPHQKSPVSLDRYDHINVTDVNSQADNVQPALATVLYDFQPLSGRELGVKKGDIVRVRRQVNSEWFEVQRGSRIGIVPRCYIAVEEARGNKQKTYFSRRQLCARYNFKAENKHELSLNKGDIVDVIRRVDENWLQGKCGHNTGIFPANYVETISVDTTDSTSLLDTKHEQSAPRSSHNWTGRVNSPVTQTQTNSDKSTSSYGRYLQQLPAPSYHSHSTLEQPTVAYRALFPYMRQNDDELELREGDILHVLEQCPDGWFVGTNQRTSLLGTFPGNYVQRV